MNVYANATLRAQKLTVRSVGRLGIGGTRSPCVDVGGRNKERLFEGSPGLGELLDVLESDAGRVAFSAGGGDDAFVTLFGLCGKRNSRALA